MEVSNAKKIRYKSWMFGFQLCLARMRINKFLCVAFTCGFKSGEQILLDNEAFGTHEQYGVAQNFKFYLIKRSEVIQ